MVKAIRVHELGGPEVLKWEDVEIGEPKEGEIRVKNKAIGLNFIDVYFRKGVYKASTMPFTPGMEAAGVVTAVGPGLMGRKVGDVVAYAGNPMGSYAEEQILPAEKVVPVPPSLDPIVAASIILKAMTAHMLVRRCFKVEPGHTVLVHAAAGGVGSLLCQWANALGATVIGTVSTTEKVAQAKEDGCHHVIMYKEEDFVTRVNEITSGKGVDVVYDSVGKDTFQSSCMPDPLPMTELAAKSLFLTRASLLSYTATRDELLQAAGEVFSNVASGILRVRINHKYPLSQVAQAHEDLEGRKMSGSVVLIPDGVFEQQRYLLEIMCSSENYWNSTSRSTAVPTVSLVPDTVHHPRSPVLLPAALTLALAVAGFLPSTAVGPINIKIERRRMRFPHQEGVIGDRTALHRRDLPRTLKSRPSQKNDASSPLSFNFAFAKINAFRTDGVHSLSDILRSVAAVCLISDVFKSKLSLLLGLFTISHVRYSTAGASMVKNV
ncbi:hypothetical protein RHGRI_008305 [Rhododendron griersonianum]|uniref:Enoyl reductase (ER) domain-containing protein n=1 Tax=Rhododendron griersonianum TaxID=479676 RepID=A0AAV6L0W9_9ERIC|nr:hypothetical protein RHGRI_008305 [Rhododendron griersonianum]